MGWALLWILGIPIPILLLLFVMRGCTWYQPRRGMFADPLVNFSRQTTRRRELFKKAEKTFWANQDGLETHTHIEEERHELVRACVRWRQPRHNPRAEVRASALEMILKASVQPNCSQTPDDPGSSVRQAHTSAPSLRSSRARFWTEASLSIISRALALTSARGLCRGCLQRTHARTNSCRSSSICVWVSPVRLDLLKKFFPPFWIVLSFLWSVLRSSPADPRTSPAGVGITCTRA
jgi:hypothetical protein